LDGFLVGFLDCFLQCCGSGSGIRDWVPFWPLDPGSGMGESQHQDPGSGMNNPDHIF
jgi:hypothetical protein